MFVPAQDHVRIRRAGINGATQWVEYTEQRQTCSLEKALDAGLIVTVPAQYEHILVHREGKIHAWGDDLARLVWHRRPPTNEDCYAILWDYVERDVWILECQDGAWRFDKRSDFKGVERELLTNGVPAERALIPAAPACAVCQHRDSLLIAPWQVCPGCMVRHSLRCIEHWVEQVRALALYKQQWPLACVSCREEGVRVFSSNSHYEPDDYDYCPKCTRQGRCAHCGRHGLTEECEGPCHWCGWNVDEDHLMPATVFVCLCSAEEDAELPWVFLDDEDFA